MQRDSVERYVQIARAEGADVYQMCACMPKTGCFYPPTLITNVNTVSTVVQEEIFGPVLTVLSFRTPKEAIAIANQTRSGHFALCLSDVVCCFLHSSFSHSDLSCDRVNAQVRLGLECVDGEH